MVAWLVLVGVQVDYWKVPFWIFHCAQWGESGNRRAKMQNIIKYKNLPSVVFSDFSDFLWGTLMWLYDFYKFIKKNDFYKLLTKLINQKTKLLLLLYPKKN